MKYLSDIINPMLTELFEKHGVFFAFSNEQLGKHAKKGVEYVNLGGGCICPKENAKQFVKEQNEVTAKAISLDLEEHGKDAIIRRELANHECWYTGEIYPVVEKLDAYGITEQEIQEAFYASQG